MLGAGSFLHGLLVATQAGAWYVSARLVHVKSFSEEKIKVHLHPYTAQV
jgi:hypothetical protein